MNNAVILGVTCAYLVLMIAIGIWAARKVKNKHDFPKPPSERDAVAPAVRCIAIGGARRFPSTAAARP